MSELVPELVPISVLASDCVEPAPVRAARRALRELPVELDRVLAAIRAGMDPELATETTRQIQRDLAAAQATLDAWDVEHQRPAPLTADDIAAALDHAGDLAGLLAEAERETRARLYRTLDLMLNLDPVGDPPTLDVRLQLCGGGGGLRSRRSYVVVRVPGRVPRHPAWAAGRSPADLCP